VKNRADIEKRIKDMETELNAQKDHPGATTTTAPGPADAQPPLPAPAPVPVAVQPSPTPVATVQTPQPSENQGRGLRIAGIVSASVGVAAVATGIAFGLHASSLQDEAYTGTYNDSKLQDSKSFRTLQWVSIGIGSAAVVTGGVLYYLGASAKNTPVAFAPLVTPGMGGAAVFGRF
jgi:hypothetical protein